VIRIADRYIGRAPPQSIAGWSQNNSGLEPRSIVRARRYLFER